MKKVISWIKNNQMVSNTVKTFTMVVGSKNSIIHNHELQLLIDGATITWVQETKLLGVTVNSELTWAKHVEVICAKMARAISMLKRHKQALTGKATKHSLGPVIC